MSYMRGSRKFCQKEFNGPTLIALVFSLFSFFRYPFNVFFFLNPKPLKAGHYRSTGETLFKWRFAGGGDGGPTLNFGMVAF